MKQPTQRGGARVAGKGKLLGRTPKEKTTVISFRVLEKNKEKAQIEVKKLIKNLAL